MKVNFKYFTFQILGSPHQLHSIRISSQHTSLISPSLLVASRRCAVSRFCGGYFGFHFTCTSMLCGKNQDPHGDKTGLQRTEIQLSWQTAENDGFTLIYQSSGSTSSVPNCGLRIVRNKNSGKSKIVLERIFLGPNKTI